MVARELVVDIESYAARMDRTNALFTWAQSGRLTPAVLSNYLFNMRILVQHGPEHLARAHRSALRHGELALAAHYAEKREEELGHHEWAENDLGLVEARFGARPHGRPCPGLLQLLRFIEDTIDRDPRLYLAYLLLAEYLVVLRVDEWLALLEARCGIPKEMVSILGAHAELDRHHTAEGIEVIERFASDPALRAPMREVVADALEHFEAFCVSALETPTEPTLRGERDACPISPS